MKGRLILRTLCVGFQNWLSGLAVLKVVRVGKLPCRFISVHETCNKDTLLTNRRSSSSATGVGANAFTELGRYDGQKYDCSDSNDNTSANHRHQYDPPPVTATTIH